VVYGRFITAVVNFLIIAAVLFFIVRVAEQFFSRDEKPSEVDLLTDIRDELRRR
jgi:large conductance mechanosensitive channel